MEIIWLSALTGAFIFGLVFYLFNNRRSRKPLDKQMRQSEAYEVVKQFLIGPADTIKDVVKTQSQNFEDRMHVRVVLTDSQAFWILNNTLFVAEQVNGMIEKDTTRPVDTMGMDKVELDKTAIIVDALTEGGEDDYRSTRN